MNVLDTRNLTFFRRHLDVDCLHADFAADFGFRTDGSHFSIFREPTGAPGPDEAFAHVQMDARRLFVKLLGMEVDFKGPYHLYTSTNHYRSHLHEFFHWTAGQHQVSPPLEGECLMFFAGCDELVVHYRLRNVSEAEVPVQLWFRSEPCAGEKARQETKGAGFCFGMTQKVASPYQAWMRVMADDPKMRFGWKDTEFRSAPINIRFRSREERTWTFRCEFSSGPTRGTGVSPVSFARRTKWTGETPIPRKSGHLKAALDRANRVFQHLPPLTGEARRFQPLVLRAAGILLSNRSRDTDRQGRAVTTIHAGKSGVAATWWWDGAIHLMGLGVCGDRETIRGAMHLLLDGLGKDGCPVVRYNNGTYHEGAQMPILAWGLTQAHAASPDPALLRRSYPGLARYARWWLARRGASGLVTLPGGCTAQDDSPRWTPNFPLAWEKGGTWDAKNWGHSHNADFECPDVNAHLYLELRALERMARAQGRLGEAQEWQRVAVALGKAINYRLFDPVTGLYQDRHIPSGRFTGYLTAGCFLPLYAGLAPKQAAVAACRRYLLDPERFYTTLPFSGVDRAHPAFKSGGRLYEVPQYPGALLQSAYWLGRVWLQYSYWLTGALWQAGLKKEADAAADKILDALLPQESLYECYDPLTATGNGHAEFSWGAAPVLVLAYRQYRKGALGA
jgi:hypothetical protein